MINGLLHARGALDPPPGQLRQQQNDPTPPLWRQRLPNTRRQRFAHDAIQASARWRKALGIRVSAIRRILATYKRQLVWGIELLFRWIKQHLKIRKFLGLNENAIRLQLYAALVAYALLRIAANANKVAIPILRFTDLVRQFLYERRRVAAIEKPPPVSPSQRRDKSSPHQMSFRYV